MESNNYEWFMAQTVEAMLPRFSPQNMVLTMKIEARWDDYGYAEDGNTKVRDESIFRKIFFLAFHRPHNYTKVLMIENPDETKNGRLLPQAGTYQMKQLSDHDSCWRSDGFNWVFKTFVEAWDFFKTEIGIEGRKIDPSFHYSIFQGEPQLWFINKLEAVDVESDKRWTSDYIIEFDRKIEMRDVLEIYMKNKNDEKGEKN